MQAAGSRDPQADVIAFLQSGSAFRNAPAQRIDTHAASIFLSGDRAWKLKRAVRFDYLDFTTPDQRRAILEEELRLNQRTAPDLYRGVHAVTRDSAGRLAIDGEGEPVDWLLEMRRFADGALLDTMADRGQLDYRMLMRLADRICAFHDTAEPVPTCDGTAPIRHVIDGNFTSMRDYPDILAPKQAQLLTGKLLELTTEIASLLNERARSGRVRHVHGDLHLANIAMIDGEPTLFDCLEFSRELATIDVLYDLAFLLMDLWHRGLRTAANIVYNRYLDRSSADEGGIRLLPLFLSIRASVRTHVVAAQSARAGDDPMLAMRARDYLQLALAFLGPKSSRLVAIGGLSGSGKSTLARALGGSLGRAPGARILRSDVLRKRLAGVAPETQLPAASYSSESSVSVYTVLGRTAAAALASGQAVIADAVFAAPDERDAIEAVAHRAEVAFTGLWLEAPGAALLDRIATRGPDASDADAEVAAAQAHLQIGNLGMWHILSSAAAPEHLISQARVEIGV